MPKKTIRFALSIACQLVFASLCFAQSTSLPAGWALPNSQAPLCAPEGQMCRFDGDCCQGVCKNFQICEAPLFCVPPHFGCNTDDECCNGSCNLQNHECNAR